jgi:hypothetical protein
MDGNPGEEVGCSGRCEEGRNVMDKKYVPIVGEYAGAL